MVDLLHGGHGADGSLSLVPSPTREPTATQRLHAHVRYSKSDFLYVKSNSAAVPRGDLMHAAVKYMAACHPSSPQFFRDRM